MKRLVDTFIHHIKPFVSEKQTVLEVGSGDGRVSAQLTRHVGFLVGVEPMLPECRVARERGIKNAEFACGDAETLPLKTACVDLVLYTLSFHHVARDMMPQALDEARRVARPSGLIMFLEPGKRGSFFEAEKMFNACDGNEDAAKDAAVRAMRSHRGLSPVCMMRDKTEFSVDSVEDFKDGMRPTARHRKLKNEAEIEPFLDRYGHRLKAERFIYVFRAR